MMLGKGNPSKHNGADMYHILQHSATLYFHSFIFLQVPNLEHRASFGVSLITYTIRHTVGLLWTSDQPVAEASTYTGQHNI
jgi:hypothetical protein